MARVAVERLVLAPRRARDSEDDWVGEGALDLERPSDPDRHDHARECRIAGVARVRIEYARVGGRELQVLDRPASTAGGD